MRQVLEAFTADPKVLAMAILVGLDLLLGILAAIKTKEFTLKRLSDFLKEDILWKLVPYYGLWAATYVGGDLVIPGIDVGAIAAAGFLAITASLIASIYKSVADLGLAPAPNPPVA